MQLHAAMAKLAHVQGREYFPNVFSVFNRPLTYHPLGGCPMSDQAQTGVVNEFGRVFGCPGLYVADGSIVPTSLGRNPAFTIAALAERIAEAMVRDWDDTLHLPSSSVSPLQVKLVN
jgi:cholesterol oxidase